VKVEAVVEVVADQTAAGCVHCPVVVHHCHWQVDPDWKAAHSPGQWDVLATLSISAVATAAVLLIRISAAVAAVAKVRIYAVAVLLLPFSA